MRKTDKKIDNIIRLALTEVCETLKEKVEGFIWLTHSVNFSQGLNSLVVTFMFESQALLDKAYLEQQTNQMITLAQARLKMDNISVANPKKQYRFEANH
ncbi:MULTISPECIES: Fis family transcriptional regulator [unclassified Shewanella]|uniref:Fis family transcriptional regulator n=1 Tax=unclassified Shewanella TaxID=196818 RepID=UPI001BBBA68B|nr:MULTISPECIES: Fis family transcriptional regulator [unclassified Shewanella]GIU07705.1 hypothetical protein TUM4444_07550 [Shewanella sp. MBTL60-112-B1]GIU30323.1 hypothetical protein TUM4445_13540 [Shewanella sp. MBTL60-112-B2]